MRNILYWSFLILLAIFLAYISPFGLYHLIFLAGGVIVVFLSRRIRVSFLGSVFVYVAVYWTTIGVFSNVKERREFFARYEPYVHAGKPEGYTFYYLDYPGFYERVDSADLNKLLEDKRPSQVRMVLEIVRDFGKLRAYSVRSVEGIPVDQNWSGGNPPWDVLRQKPPGN
jgi:hypothetical protein